ncbi:MAG TPA: ABC transporter substrate-binding protein [Mycobacteriales bacterium]|nr:ABC transporter substrate-binding protein [Mycobacteriales bacterium]
MPSPGPFPGRFSRRRFLAGSAGAAAAVAGTAVAGTAAGCAAAADVLGLGRTVRVAVTWSAEELQAFRAVLDGFGDLPYAIDLVPLGDDISAAFGPQRPDIIMLPQPGLVTENHDKLQPLPDQVSPGWPYAAVWSPVSSYGLPFKMTDKSTVWYRKSVFAEYGLDPPPSWSKWLNLNARLARAGVAPLAVAAADGWTLTDIFENVLLGISPQTYEGLVPPNPRARWTDPVVAQAFRLLGRMWAAPGTLAGGVNRSLVQQFPEAVVEVFGHQKAAMVISADFAEPVIRRYAIDPGDVGVFPFPVIDGDDQERAGGSRQPPLVVGGDVAVLLKHAGDTAVDDYAVNLVTRLANEEAPLPWITGHGGFLAANLKTPIASYSDLLKPLAEQLARPNVEQPIAFDLSDRLGALGGSEGLWRVLQDFLVAVGGRGPTAVPDAADIAVRRLNDLALLRR